MVDGSFSLSCLSPDEHGCLNPNGKGRACCTDQKIAGKEPGSIPIPYVIIVILILFSFFFLLVYNLSVHNYSMDARLLHLELAALPDGCIISSLTPDLADLAGWEVNQPYWLVNY